MKRFSNEGSLRITRPDTPNLTGSQKSALIRKGNELYNSGRIEEAKRVFLTTGYSDGLIRLGDYYYEHHQALEAFRMYCLAPDEAKKNMILTKMALVVRGWMKDNKSASTKKEVGNNG